MLYHQSQSLTETKYKVLEYHSNGIAEPDNPFRALVPVGGGTIKGNLELDFVGQQDDFDKTYL